MLSPIIQNTKVQTNIFPDFKTFEVEDYDLYQSFISQFPQHCDFTLSNLLVWLGGNEHIEFSWLNNNIVFKFSDPLLFKAEEGAVRYTILGSTMAYETLRQFHLSGLETSLHLLPDYFVDTMTETEKQQFIITDDRDNWDYLVNIDDLIRKQGAKYENFRYQIKYFLKNYSDDAVIKPIDITTDAGISAIANALHCWPNIHSFNPEGNDPLRSDAAAIDKVLRLQQTLLSKHQAIGIYIANNLQGFSIFHIPPAVAPIAMGNHIKWNGEFKRLFDILAYATCSKLQTQGIHLLNAEQDLGSYGIRHHKLGLNPVGFYKKYNLHF